MTQVHWTNPVTGQFDTAADWTGGVVPGAGDDAILDAAGAAFTVTTSTNETVNGIDLASNATLAITGGAFSASNGTGGGANAGTISVGVANFQLGGTMMNTGTIALIGSRAARRHPANLIIQGSVTLEGGGTVSLLDNKSFGVIKGKTGSHSVLTNIDNTISGSGKIGIGFTTSDLVLINDAAGVIDANDRKHPLTIVNDRPSTNTGLMEATGGGALSIENTAINNTGGMIEATAEGAVDFTTGTIVGGGILAGENSVAQLTGQTTATGTVLSTMAGGNIEILNFSTVTTGGVIANAGFIQIGAGESDRSSLVLDTNTSLTGGGTVAIEASSGTIVGTDDAVVLTNVDNTISAAGSIGNGSLTLINDTAGVIQSDGATLTVDTGENTIANAGLIENEGASGANMVVASPIANTGKLEVAGGTLTVKGAVTGPDGSAVIAGGTLDFSSGFNEKVTFVGGAGVLGLAKSLNFHRAIAGFSATGGTTLDLGDIGYVSPGEATYSGTKSAGVLTVTDGTHTALINLKGDYLGVTFTASSDNNGGTIVVASMSGGAHQFIAAAAALGGGAGGSVSVVHDASRPHPLMLTRPGVREA